MRRLGKFVKARYHGKHMRDTKKRALWRAFQIFASSFVAVALIGVFVFVTQGRDIPVLNPEGLISGQQYTLILITVGLGFFVVVPVFILLFVVAWRYRASNKKAKYEPELEGNKGLEILWWSIPCLIILALAIITTISTHALDPYKELESDKPAVTIEVVALKWNWLFIYPNDEAATLNYMNIPEGTPVNLKITSDAPMNAFWIPALAGQVYAMSGMTTQLHLMADTTGSYNGSTTNISGPGYADLRFKVNSLPRAEYTRWLKEAARSENMLTSAHYAEVAEFSEHKPETTYMLMAPHLFDDIINKYMHSKSSTPAPIEEHSREEEHPHEGEDEHAHMEGMDM